MKTCIHFMLVNAPVSR